MAYDSPPRELLENVRAERDRYRRQRDRAAELHAKDHTGHCSHCEPTSEWPSGQPFPCPTYRALTED